MSSGAKDCNENACVAHANFIDTKTIALLSLAAFTLVYTDLASICSSMYYTTHVSRMTVSGGAKLLNVHVFDLFSPVCLYSLIMLIKNTRTDQ